MSNNSLLGSGRLTGSVVVNVNLAPEKRALNWGGLLYSVQANVSVSMLSKCLDDAYKPCDDAGSISKINHV